MLAAQVWVNGPAFLLEKEANWPQFEIPQKDTNEEVKFVFLHSRTKKDKCINFIKFENFSSFRKLLRSVAWIVRYRKVLENVIFKDKPEKLNKIEGSWLMEDELEAARDLIIKQAQYECFANEIAELTANRTLSKQSSIFKLCPILVDGILRVDGRTKNAEHLSFDAKFPIILDKNHRLTSLLLDEYHKMFAHQHLETCVNEIRTKYWIPDLRVCVKKARTRCQACKNRLATPKAPQMGPLPRERLTPYYPPFTFTGMDTFGHIYITVGRSTQKRWVILYTCLNTRAIHMEIVSSLSTDACIMAFKNFTSIRPKPKTLYCDNGKNFVGMAKELKQAWREWRDNKQTIESTLYNATHEYQTEFKFIPPGTPWQGGAWERMIRTVKNVLKVLVKNSRLREESLRCFLLEAMDIVNSRPLTYIPLENGLEPALTPNTLLKFSAPIVSGFGGSNDADVCGRKQWRIAQYLANQFWKRWVKEITPDLTRRTKWHQRTEALKVDDIVIVVDETRDRNCWERGRIIKVYPDSAGHVRFADVKTASGIYKRPSLKLAVLDIVN